MIKNKLSKIIVAATLTACAFSFANADTVKTPVIKAPVNNNVKSDASYFVGYSIASSITNNIYLKEMKLNTNSIIEGFKTAIKGLEPKLTEEQIKQNINIIRTIIAEKMNIDSTKKFLNTEKSILTSDLTPRTDVKNAKVKVFEFFDYQCMYCSKIAPTIEKIMKNNKDVEVVFVEFPIFGGSYPASQYAAEVGTAIYKLYGSKAYVEYHDAIFASGQDEGKLTNKTIDTSAKKAGADLAKVKATIKSDNITQHIKDTMSMGMNKLGIHGTPYLAVVPTKNATLDNSTVIAGYSNYNNIEAAITKAKA